MMLLALISTLFLDCPDLLAQTSFTLQPSALTTFESGLAQLNVGVSVSPAGAFALQWQRNGVNLSNSTRVQNAVLVNPNSQNQSTFGSQLYFDNRAGGVTLADAGLYTVILHANGHSLTSNPVQLTVTPFPSKAPAVTQSPPNVTTPLGGSAFFRVFFNCSPDTTFQWFKNNEPLQGPESSGYVLVGADGSGRVDYAVGPVATADQGASYKVMLSNSKGTAQSIPATLTLGGGQAPSFNFQSPAGTTIILQSGATLTLSSGAGGDPVPTYLLTRDGTAIQTGSLGSFSVPFLQPSDSGRYQIIASNSLGVAQGKTYEVTVGQPTDPTPTPNPMNCIGAASQIRGATLKASVFYPENGSYDIQFAASGSTFTIPAGGYLPAQSGSWQFDFSGLDIFGNPVPTVRVFNLKNKSNQFVNASFLLFCDDNDLNVLVDFPSEGSHFAKYSWSNQPAATGRPTVLRPPQPTTVTVGMRAMLDVYASGAEPLSYQWRKGGEDMPGQTGRTLVIPTASALDAATYAVVVSNSAGSVTSAGAPLAVNPALPPKITRQPVDTDVFVGDMLTLQASISTPDGTPLGAVITREWTKGGVTVKSGRGDIYATSLDTYVATSATKQDSGVYQYFANLNGGVTNSVPVTVRVVDATDKPVFRPATAKYSLVAGQGITLLREVAGTQPPNFSTSIPSVLGVTYQWRLNGEPIPGQTLPFLDIPSVSSANVGLYTLAATSAAGTSISSPQEIVLVEPCAAPTAAASFLGKELRLANAENTSPWAPGETVITFAATGNKYTVAANGGNPEYVSTWSYSTSGGSLTLSNLRMANGTPKSVSVFLYCSGNDLQYSISLTSPPFDNLAGGASLRSPAVELPAPTITAEPVSVVVNAGQPASFTVQAQVANNAPITYQWKKGTVAIPTATSATHSIPAAAAEDAGSYSVTVTANGKQAESITATLTVNPALPTPVIVTQPVGKTLLLGESVTLSVVPEGNPLSYFYQWRKNGEDLPGQTFSTLNLFADSTAVAGSYRVLVRNLQGGVKLSDPAVIDVNATVVAPVITLDPATQTVSVGQQALFSVLHSGTPPFNYQWFKGTTAIPDATQSTYSINPVTAASAGGYSVKVSNAAGTATSNPATLTVLQDNSCLTAASLPGRTLRLTPAAAQGKAATLIDFSPSGAAFTIRTGGSLAAVSGTWQFRKEGSSVNFLTLNGLQIGGATAEIAMGCPDGYEIPVGESFDQSGTWNLEGTVVAVAPSISQHPKGMTNFVGAPLTLSVVAAGDAPLTYQWRKNGENIPSATQATYSVASAAEGNSGTYTVVVSNGAGFATSNPAQVLINPVPVIPQISSHPAGQTLTAGATLRLEVVASGVPTPAYQWKKNGENLPNGNAAVYTLAGAQPGESGTYTVVVSNSAGNATSNPAQVLINPAVVAPVISVDPRGATVSVGATVEFAASLSSGSAPFTYQWTRNNQPLPGETGATLRLANVQAGQAGTYRVVISNSAGSATSGGAELVVNAVQTRQLSIAGYQALSPTTIAFPIELTAQGNEALIAFSLRFNPLTLTNVTALAGTQGGAPRLGRSTQPTITLVTSNLAEGSLGVRVTQPEGGTFAAGSSVVASLQGDLVEGAHPEAAGVTFTDSPVARSVVETNGATSTPATLVLPAFIPAVISTNTIFSTGLFEQLVSVANPGGLDLEQTRLVVSGLGVDGLGKAVRVFNATGLNAAGEHYLDLGALQAGASLSVNVQFYVSDLTNYPGSTVPGVRTNAAAVFRVEPGGSFPNTLPTGTPVKLLGVTPFTNAMSQAAVLVTFETLKDRFHYVQQASNLTNWTTLRPALLGTGRVTEWVDRNPPPAPAGGETSANRFYRVIVYP